jgi:hypothetical protein
MLLGSTLVLSNKSLDSPVRRRKNHDYLGIQIDLTEDQKVTMYDYINELIKETPAELL